MSHEDLDRTPSPSRSAFEMLFRSHYRAVFAYTARRLPADAANDVAADTFIVAWRRFHEVPVEGLPWLIAVARNLVRNEARAERRRQTLHERIASQPVRLIVDDDPPIRSDEVFVAYCSLTESDQELLALTAWEELTPAQIARVLGRSPVSVRVALHRAKSRLRSALSEVLAADGERLEKGVVNDPCQERCGRAHGSA